MRARISFGVTNALVQLAAAASLLLLLLCAAPRPAAAVPFASLSPKPGLREVWYRCVLTASGLGISSITAADLAQYSGRTCGIRAFNGVDLSNNLLTALPDGLFSGLPLDLIDLSRNRFTAGGVANFAGALGSTAEPRTWTRVDLSFNEIGPAVPAALAQLVIPAGGLLLIGCGITDVPPNTFAGSSWNTIDLSLNNLRSGLHPLSFSGGPHLQRIGLSNCNLRASSLVPGVFDTTVSNQNSLTLHMDNMDADLSTMDSSALDARFPFHELSPKLPLDPRLLSASQINPPGQAHTNRISAERYLASWPNYFDPFPAGLFYTAAPGAPFWQPKWDSLYLGDIARMDAGWFGNAAFTGTGAFSFTLAPQSAVAAMGSDPTTFCPLQSVVQSLSLPLGQTALDFRNLRILGFDLPPPADPLPTFCALPDCTAMGGCRQFSIFSIGLSTEPALLQRDVMRWLSTIAQPRTPVYLKLKFHPPPLQLWNPALNRSDWVPDDLLCDIDLESLTPPALPYSVDPAGFRLPFPPPGGLLRCLAHLQNIDWRAVRLFSSDMLVGLSVLSQYAVNLDLDLDALYGGARPVPVGFFDPLQSNIDLISKCASSCSRISSRCPYFVDGECQSCPMGLFKRTMQGKFAYCSPCPVGSYCDAAVSDDHIPCPRGSYQFEGSQSSCILCQAGTYNALTGRSDPSSCINCPPGRFSPSAGGDSLDSCQLCPAGTANGGTGAAACAKCARGYHQEATGSFACEQCPAGRFQPDVGSSGNSSACISCPSLAPQSPAGSSSSSQCTAPQCLDGFYSSAADSSPCASRCPAGAFCQLGVATLCSMGSFNPSTGGTDIAACRACPVGHYNGAPGAASCRECAVGTYQDAPGAFSCHVCAAGRYQPVVGANSSSACVSCPVSAPESASGSGSLVQCRSPVCPDGRHTASASDAPCSSPCPVGAFCQLGVVTLCPPATFNDAAGGAAPSSCRDCPAGRANGSPGMGLCPACAAGQYQNHTGQLQCEVCASGKYQPEPAATSRSACRSCPSFTPNSPPGSSSAAQCVSPVCPAGLYSAAGDERPCAAPCPAGAYCQLGVVSLCPVATFNGAVGGTGPGSCSACPVGRANGVPGSALCAPCAPGQFQNRTGQLQCDVCPSGTYQPQSTATTSSACVLCPSTTPFSPAGSGSSLQCTAQPCPDGWISQSSDPAPCSSRCPVGSWCQLGVTMACGPAHYNDQPGGRDSSACLPCPTGTSNAYPGASSCVPCSPGYWQDAEAASTCEPCPANTFQPATRATSADFCQPCPPSAPLSPSASGSLFQCSTGVICVKGLFTADGGAACAEPCRLGSFCEGGEMVPCPAGSYSDREGMGSCTPCGAGSIGSLVGSQSASDCAACPPSTYSAAPVSTACAPCSAGSFSIGSGSSSAFACVFDSKCVTAQSLATAGRDLLSSSASLCPTGGLQPIVLSALLPDGAAHAAAFMAQAGRLIRDLNATQEAGLDATSAATEAVAQAALAVFKPAKNLASLRLAATGSDTTLSAFRATEVKVEDTTDHSSAGSNGGSFTLSSAATAGLIAGLLVVAFAPLIAYRLLPAKAATVLDQFSLAHVVHVGATPTNTPTRLGAVISWSFLWVALLAAVLLGLQDNTLRTTELLPPSATTLADTATASWQITLRAYTVEDAAAMAVWCRSSNSKLLSRQSGFSGSFALRAAVQGQSCAVTADCAACGVSALASVTFAFPYSSQLIEWELWVNGAQPHSWGRRYGVLTQLPLPGGRLLDAESELRFSVMESYHSDERSAAFVPGLAAEDKSRSGFELNFLSLSSIRPQPTDALSAASTVTIGFALQKSDVLLSTVLSDKQSMLQLLTVIASAVVSLFSIFAITFRLAEHHLLRRLGWSSGPVAPPVAPAVKRIRSGSDAEPDEESARNPSTSPLPSRKSADAATAADEDVHSGPDPDAAAEAPGGYEPSLRVVTSPSGADPGTETAAAASAAAESASSDLPEPTEDGLALASPSGATAATTGSTVYSRLSSPSATGAIDGAGSGSALSPSHLKYAAASPPSPRPPTAPGRVRLHALPPLRPRMAGLASAPAPAGPSGSAYDLDLDPLTSQVDVPGSVLV